MKIQWRELKLGEIVEIDDYWYKAPKDNKECPGYACYMPVKVLHVGQHIDDVDLDQSLAWKFVRPSIVDVSSSRIEEQERNLEPDL